VALDHGSAISQSKYVRETVYSGRAGVHLGEALQLPQGFFLDVLGHLGALDLAAQLFDLRALLLAELFLNRFELLAQDALSGRPPDLFLDAGVDARAHLENLVLFFKQAQDEHEALLDVERLQDALLGFSLDIEIRRDEVGQLPRIGYAGGHRVDLHLGVGQEREHLVEEPDHLLAEGFGFDILLDDGLQGADLGHEIRRLLGKDLYSEAVQPLDPQHQGAWGGLGHASDPADRANLIEIFGGGMLDGGVALGEHADDLCAGEGIFDQADRAFAAHGQRQERMGEDHGVFEGQDRQDLRELGLLRLSQFKARWSHHKRILLSPRRACQAALAEAVSV
jgi:hypothetical protein